jgi:hypothetical protein
VSRAGFHKKLKAGGLTAFSFHFTKFEKSLLRTKKTELIEKQSYMFIPIYELLQWEDELLTKKEIRKFNNEKYMFIDKKHKLAKNKKLTSDDLMERLP